MYRTRGKQFNPFFKFQSFSYATHALFIVAISPPYRDSSAAILAMLTYPCRGMVSDRGICIPSTEVVNSDPHIEWLKEHLEEWLAEKQRRLKDVESEKLISAYRHPCSHPLVPLRY